MPERFKVVLDHARRYTSARLYLYLFYLRGHFQSRDKDTTFYSPMPKTPCCTQTLWLYVLWRS